MDENELRKRILLGNKTERLVFAVTPQMKEAIERVAKEECTSVSALLTALAVDKVLGFADYFGNE